ncbi:MAG TPA: OmpA family protein [Gemmatimonadaceae bacterium]
MRQLLASIAMVCALLAGATAPAPAQGLFGKLKAKAKQRVDNEGDRAVDRAVDRVVDAVVCAVTDLTCIAKAHNEGKSIKVTDANGNAVSSADSAAAVSQAVAAAAAAADEGIDAGPSGGGAAGASAAAPGTGVWLNYDFVPGDKVLYYDDFSGENVGDLPRHLEMADGNAEVVEIKGEKYFHTTTGATFYINFEKPLPERFTIEATYHVDRNAGPIKFIVGKGGYYTADVYCYQNKAGIYGGGKNGSKSSEQEAKGIAPNDFVHCRAMYDGGYVKAYLNEQRLAQLNGLTFTRGTTIEVYVPRASDGAATLIKEIRIAEGGKKLYDVIAATGRVSTHGILFATGSSTISPESTPTLKEIGDMLEAHPELKLVIEGHTDNVGAAAANQTLSEQRAAAVKQYLVSTYHIDAARLQAKGYGASKPVASNDTPEGRQQNRRVELVKVR